MKGAEKVKVEVYTGLDGSLSVFGDVENEQTAKAVMSEILATTPQSNLSLQLERRTESRR